MTRMGKIYQVVTVGCLESLMIVCVTPLYQPSIYSHPPQADDTFNGYSLEGFPVQALPDRCRKHLGKHSYTIHRGNARIEVLLKQKAFFVRGAGGNQHVSWSKYGSLKDAWISACARAGVLP